MALMILTACSLQFVRLRRIGISKPSNYFTKSPTTPSLSLSPLSSSYALRYAPFCCRPRSTSSDCSVPSSAKIFIKGLPFSTTEGRLMKVFSEFGDVTLVQLPIDKESGQSLGFAYIWFVKEESAELAVKEMNGKFFDGRFIYVTIAKPGSSKSSKRTTDYKF
ncbi:hypothetical protein RJT34_32136 [Clitoria ternatea]|uniref:RRM domain-containing protein n=1 Tax=Clitoria ternatea TaxID=43366 RepID=A0AAN9EVH5_CLITE